MEIHISHRCWCCLSCLLKLPVILYWLYRASGVMSLDWTQVVEVAKKVCWVLQIPCISNRVGFKWPPSRKGLLDIFIKGSLLEGATAFYSVISLIFPGSHRIMGDMKVWDQNSDLVRINSDRFLGKWASSLCMRCNIQHSWYGFVVRKTYLSYPVYSWMFSQQHALTWVREHYLLLTTNELSTLYLMCFRQGMRDDVAQVSNSWL